MVDYITLSGFPTPILNVLVTGHSHAYWLGKFVDDAGLFANFEKLGYKCRINFLGPERKLVRSVGLMSSKV